MRSVRIRPTPFIRPTAYLLLALALVVPLGGFALRSSSQLPIQPALLSFAAQHPEAHVRVIVQKLAKDAVVEAAIAQLGGQVTQDLHITNAVAAVVPGNAVQAPVVKTVPPMLSSSAAVASSPLLVQLAISPAPTSTGTAACTSAVPNENKPARLIESSRMMTYDRRRNLGPANPYL